ncbi:MAG: UDP-N-acetylmuramoyl-L-alanyl-D-glutamate--2,6-diaminopimelate ligase [Candidatus Delongbacteria bacterium]|jgi:UDP-N-acetylmuramoyl-L-alanyl-D-glutamate--2,6-diaminopimelate ligase|nr:UDP-N-acetylmuramoyl-L-alanyl-D-glutamate--2,6-diaminopimelate ligase [Candidatus Delongbacteria bacterium]
MRTLDLKHIEQTIDVVKAINGAYTHYNKLCFDSRDVSGDAIFVAVPGTSVDGHEYISQAVEKGARLIVCEKLPQVRNEGIGYIQVKDAAVALSRLASEFYGNPSKELKLVGITGTNGKTTTATMLYNLVENMGYKAGLLSTIRNYIHNSEVRATHTTPDPVQINRLMAEMVDTGCEFCFMEVSSHAIEQKRIDGLDFDVAVFTNITHDHLDYHKTFSNYVQAKKRFFDKLDKHAFALVNTGDKHASVMVQNSKAIKKTFALSTMADYRLSIGEKHFDGMQLFINGNELWTPVIGEYNACNMLAAFATADLLGFPQVETLKALSELSPVEGRLETIRSDDGKTAVVDYAHTPDALENVLTTLFDLKRAGSQLICVCGAGGDRDPKKRPEMGRIVALYSNKIIITSDNPRSEKPESIIEDVESGVPTDKLVHTLKITDRKEAIKMAWNLADSGDLILVAGKGHETYQEINGVKHHFDDREVIYELINM